MFVMIAGVEPLAVPMSLTVHDLMWLHESPSTIRRTYDRAGTVYPQAKLARATDFYLEGMSIAKAALQVSMHESALSQHLSDLGIRRNRGKPPMNLTELERRMDAGQTTSHIATAMDRAKSTVRDAMANIRARRSGVKP